MSNNGEQFFVCLTDISIPSFVKGLLSIFPIFLLFLLICRSSLHILDTSSRYVSHMYGEKNFLPVCTVAFPLT